ncbi:hypothetical protein FB45DRAFT_743001 [Roridomyces roridus]|uniref:RRM domain-containing protein n=1 Tax=Roridomyces roridus TaxID=1738132 RepID=A0AAD7C135_9AGAR|nr:hypothetical protein FB45DRAFT_743001 [Roridomyces roridus]
MQAQYRAQPYRLNNFHRPKSQLLGNQAGHAPPAWRTASTSALPGAAKGKQPATDGSKIFLSRLPMDVGETEVEELFKKTIGPLKESFLIYNSQGKSKGMAVVAFQRPGDAVVARTKYDGKIVDGRRPIKIEVIVDAASATPSAPAAPPSLFDRLGPAKNGAPMSLRFETPTCVALLWNPRRQHNPNQPPRPATNTTTFPAPIPPRRYRTKKGPKRLKKQLESRSKEQLDRDMEDYRAQSTVH